MLVRRLLTYISYAARRLAPQALNFPLFRKETWSVVKGQILRYAFGYNGEVVACHVIVFVLGVSVFAAFFGCFRLPRFACLACYIVTIMRLTRQTKTSQKSSANTLAPKTKAIAVSKRSKRTKSSTRAGNAYKQQSLRGFSGLRV